MRSMVISYNEAYGVDADYYGYVDINVPIVMIAVKDELSNEELINDFSKGLELDEVFSTLDELKEVYNKLPKNTLDSKIHSITSELKKLNKAKSNLKELNLDTNDVDNLISEKKIEIKKLNDENKIIKDNIKNFRKIIDNDAEKLTSEYHDSDFYHLTGTIDVEYFLKNNGLFDLERLVLGKYLDEFLLYLQSRGWEYVELGNAMNDRDGNNTVTVNALYSTVANRIGKL